MTESKTTSTQIGPNSNHAYKKAHKNNKTQYGQRRRRMLEK